MDLRTRKLERAAASGDTVAAQKLARIRETYRVKLQPCISMRRFFVIDGFACSEAQTILHVDIQWSFIGSASLVPQVAMRWTDCGWSEENHSPILLEEYEYFYK